MAASDREHESRRQKQEQSKRDMIAANERQKQLKVNVPVMQYLVA